jgi:hypothetical protein
MPRGTSVICPTLFDSSPIVSDAVTFKKESGDIGFAGFIKSSIGSGSDVAELLRMGMVGTEAFPTAMLGLGSMLGIRDILMRIQIRLPPGLMDLDAAPDPTPFFSDFKDAKKQFFSYFFLITYLQACLSSV